jgi:hypothetical protein
MRSFTRISLLVSTSLLAPTLGAQQPAPPPYSLPWLLRPAAAGTVLRVDQTFASYESGGEARDTRVTSLIASYRLSPRWAPVARVTFVHDETETKGGSGLSNPLLGVTYARPLSGAWRFAGFAAFTLPVGSGGGDDPDPGAAFAVPKAIPARSAMENALFAVNYFTLIGGASVARVTPGLTFQAEVTVLQLMRARGPESQDESRTNFTAGLHAGHFFSPKVSLGGELRLQRWLTDAAPVRADEAARETVTFGVGPRFHFKLSGKRWVRPGISWSRALDDPLKGQGYDMISIDVPVSF